MKTSLVKPAVGVAAGRKLVFQLSIALSFWFNLSLFSAEMRSLSGHVPLAARKLRPLGSLESTTPLDLAIGLPLRNVAALTNLLHDLYNPASASYHRFLTPQQFAEMFGPSQEDYQAVISFANSKGLKIIGTHPNRIVLDVNGAAADIQTAFHIRLQVFQHPKEHRTFYAPDAEPQLGSEVPVLDISGLDNYTAPRPMSLHPANARKGGAPCTGSAPGGAYMGKDFRTAYVPGVTLTGAGQSVGLVEFDGYYASDIRAYESRAGLPQIPLQNMLLNRFSGYPGPNNNEVALDIEMVASMAPGVSWVIVTKECSPMTC